MLILFYAIPLLSLPKIKYSMPRRLTPTAGQKRNFLIHFVVFAIATVVMIMIHRGQSADGWAYPWHAWIIAAWGLSLIGHGCAVYTNYEDKGMVEYHEQSNRG
jgi:hypothetical protein